MESRSKLPEVAGANSSRSNHVLPKIAGVITAIAALSRPATALADDTQAHPQIGSNAEYELGTGAYGAGGHLQIAFGDNKNVQPYFKMFGGYKMQDFSATSIGNSLAAKQPAVMDSDQIHGGFTLGAVLPVYKSLTAYAGLGLDFKRTTSDFVLPSPMPFSRGIRHSSNGMIEAGARIDIFKGLGINAGLSLDMPIQQSSSSNYTEKDGVVLIPNVGVDYTF